MRHSSASRLLPLILALVTASCAADRQVSRAEIKILDRMEAQRTTQRAAFQNEQLALESDFEVPYTLEFEGKGSIIVHRVELKGGPDRPIVHTQFTYVNTTGAAIPEPRIRLMFHLPDGRDFDGSSITLSRPIGVQFASGNAHTSWIDAPTGDLHLVPGWSWSLDVDFPSASGE